MAWLGGGAAHGASGIGGWVESGRGELNEEDRPFEVGLSRGTVSFSRCLRRATEDDIWWTCRRLGGATECPLEGLLSVDKSSWRQKNGTFDSGELITGQDSTLRAKST